MVLGDWWKSKTNRIVFNIDQFELVNVNWIVL